MYNIRGTLSVAVAVLLSACGSDSTTSVVDPSTARGTLVEDPPLRIAALNADAFQSELASSTTGQQLLQLSGAPSCGVDFYYLKFWTVGGAAEATESSGALMVPTGAAPGCSGPRPVVLYAHGTQTDKAANIADITNTTNTEGVLIAAMFAAQGYIVVAPNYAGYDISTLGYHPFLNAAQQSDEMLDILAAARTALPSTFAAATTDSGKLFVTGYSEGGYVAMATQRALQAAGQTVTAAAPMSGPYALEAFGDAVFFGSVNLGSTVFAPLLTTSYQHAYGNIYSATTDVYSATYASTVATVLPSVTPLATIYANGLLPETALFDSTTPVVTIPGNPALSAELTAALAVPSNPNNPQTPLFAAGFGSPYLVTNAYRVSYALDAASDPDGALPTPAAGVPLAAHAPTQTVRKAFYLNDMRNGSWTPHEPTLLCGGDQDPTVFFSVNTGTMAAFWATLPAGLVTVLDVNAPPAGAFAAVQTGFQTSEAQLLAFYETTGGGGLSPAQAQQRLVQGYHSAVAPFCAVAARSFFSQF
ncbi:MAG TPA: prolyl oligopeptidase family serine peptidase [Steroidobacteraceae bacterium]